MRWCCPVPAPQPSVNPSPAPVPVVSSPPAEKAPATEAPSAADSLLDDLDSLGKSLGLYDILGNGTDGETL